MNDRAPIRDRTLILRILVPGLETRLRDKMKETEEESGNRGIGLNSNNSSSAGNGPNKERILDLDGVTCEPTSARNHTLWNFHCDGATYPARLVNLPCPVEIHKTHDHAAYYKSADVAQMLIVYEDEMALEEGAEEKQIDGFPSYYHSGLTPPMRRVVERRYARRDHSAAPPPRAAISDVENEIVRLMERIAMSEKAATGGAGSNKQQQKNKVPQLTSANKIFEEVVDDIVDYEPWMNDFGRQAGGVEFDADDQQCSMHPEVWLSPEELRAIKEIELDELRKKEAAANKKEAKKMAKKLEKESAAAAAAQAASSLPKPVKKGIPSKKNKIENIVDDVTAAAMMVTEGVDDLEFLELDDENILDLHFDGDEFGFDDLT
jgi:transcription initiation factor TFIID subunit 7